MEKIVDEIPPANVVVKPAADITLSTEESGVVQKESYPIIPKNNDKDDYLRPVKMSDIIKIKQEAISISSQKTKWDEIALGICTLGFGGTLSALASNVVLNTINGIIFYVLCPIFSFSLAVFVIMYKFMKNKTEVISAENIEKIIAPYEEDSKRSK